MRVVVFAFALTTVLSAAGCGPVEGGSGTSTSLIGLTAVDAPQALSENGADPLLGLRYLAPSDTQGAPTFYVSDLHVEIVAHRVQFATRFNLRYDLYYDQNGDGRFGPGDVLGVYERTKNVLGPDDAADYQVRLKSNTSLLGIAEWHAK